MAATKPFVPVIVGIYGISASGKTYMLRQLGNVAPKLDKEQFILIEHSDVIEEQFQHGAAGFSALPRNHKYQFCQQATQTIYDRCVKEKKNAVVAGHCLMMSEAKDTGIIRTLRDFQIFTHIIYLAPDVGRIIEQRNKQPIRKRSQLDSTQLRVWQEEDLKLLRTTCDKKGVLFTVLFSHSIIKGYIQNLVHGAVESTRSIGTNWISQKLDRFLASRPKAVLAIDADKTLADVHSGRLYFEAFRRESEHLPDVIFKRLGYTEQAFKQVAWETCWTNELGFRQFCLEVANTINIHGSMRELFNCALNNPSVGIVVLTCGLEQVWHSVLRRHQLDNALVIGNGRPEDHIVLPTSKADVVNHIKRRGIHVTAFGASSSDIPMLKAANIAAVVVGPVLTRSEFMEQELTKALEEEGREASQILLNHNIAPFDRARFREVRFDQAFLNRVLRTDFSKPDRLKIYLTAPKPAQLLSTPMRDATCSGPALRRAHQEAGRYLANTFLPDILDMEAFQMHHVQGGTTRGYRIEDEASTLIVAILRDSEPMVSGVHEVMPNAMLVHAKEPHEINKVLLAKAKTIILVDSDINYGKSMFDFIEYFSQETTEDHALICQPGIDVVMMTGMIQQGAIEELKQFCDNIDSSVNFNLVALRSSQDGSMSKEMENTGNRLFNTTCIQ